MTTRSAGSRRRSRSTGSARSTPPLVAEALECIGGNGYVEESALPRLFRESPLNSLWEGAGNVNALDLLRAAAKEPESVDALLAEIDLARGGDDRLDAAAERLRDELADAEELEHRARRIVELAALCLQGSLLVRHAPTEVADAFCATRLGSEGGRAYGTLPRGIDCAAIVERHRPKARSATPRPRSRASRGTRARSRAETSSSARLTSSSSTGCSTVSRTVASSASSSMSISPTAPSGARAPRTRAAQLGQPACSTSKTTFVTPTTTLAAL